MFEELTLLKQLNVFFLSFWQIGSYLEVAEGCSIHSVQFLIRNAKICSNEAVF